MKSARRRNDIEAVIQGTRQQRSHQGLIFATDDCKKSNKVHNYNV